MLPIRRAPRCPRIYTPEVETPCWPVSTTKTLKRGVDQARFVCDENARVHRDPADRWNGSFQFAGAQQRAAPGPGPGPEILARIEFATARHAAEAAPRQPATRRRRPPCAFRRRRTHISPRADLLRQVPPDAEFARRTRCITSPSGCCHAHEALSQISLNLGARPARAPPPRCARRRSRPSRNSTPSPRRTPPRESRPPAARI